MEEKRESLIEMMSRKFTELDGEGKAFIAGYITGKQEERQRGEKEREVPVA